MVCLGLVHARAGMAVPSAGKPPVGPRSGRPGVRTEQPSPRTSGAAESESSEGECMRPLNSYLLSHVPPRFLPQKL